MKPSRRTLIATCILSIAISTSSALAVDGTKATLGVATTKRSTVVVDHAPRVMIESTYGDVAVEPWFHDKVSVVTETRGGTVKAQVLRLENNTILVSIAPTEQLTESTAPRVKHTVYVPTMSALTMFIDRGSATVRDVAGAVECNVNGGDVRLLDVDNVRELTCSGGTAYNVVRTPDGLVDVPADTIQ